MLSFEQIQTIQDMIRKDNDRVFSINFNQNGECDMHIQHELMLTLLGAKMPKVNPINPSADQLFQHNGLNAIFRRFRHENFVFVKVLYPDQHITLTAVLTQHDLLRRLESVPFNYDPEVLRKYVDSPVELFDLLRGGELKR